jgi:hypothetical protein
MEQDIEDEVPILRKNEVTKDLTLEPMENMKHAPGCLRNGRKKHFRSPFISCMCTLLLNFWKVSFGEINRFAHHEMWKVKAKGKTKNIMCGAKWKHNTTLGEFMVLFSILLQMCILPLPGHSYVLYWAHGATTCNFGVFNKSEVYSTPMAIT